MTASAQPKTNQKFSIFSDSGESTAKLQLIQAVFFDRTKSALEIIKTDPDQINEQDPFAGLTPLHIAIFRQNVAVVEALANHPVTNTDAADRFGRKPIDMCIYTSLDEIFAAVLKRTYQSALLELENGEGGGVVPFKRD